MTSVMHLVSGLTEEDQPIYVGRVHKRYVTFLAIALFDQPHYDDIQ